ncbi:hypothetical protein Rsub_11263 [Raphidocelis subcapitata]|uniref:FAS1 domain-containing protein n=1 Tax=Raphidocelis subcapitata TaxID=307507 RepID=A0A2V0PFT4_9CHLO|nr:hypothetical protein Rsub_11263 [Raphidocelis subcapitata]|eukprot:GBF98714.1 hypothetical protein Rsub_11263 [Raphidocelis subcapitata]
MRTVFVSAVLLAVAACAAAQTVGPAGKFYPTVTAAAEDNNLVAFAAALKDNDLSALVNNKNLSATIFAPSDEAFKALADSDDKAVQALLADADKMAEVLKYHVVPGATLTGARLVKLIEENKGKFSFKTSQGEKINATLVDGSVNINGVPVKAVDVQGGKVMIHTIADVLVPPSLVPKAKKADAKEGEAKAEKKSESGAAGVAASLLLALPVAVAALF